MTTTTATQAKHWRDDRTESGACPSWCTDPAGHDADDMTPGNGRTHAGPMFGPFHVRGGEDGGTGQLDVSVSVEADAFAHDFLNPESLRVIAHQAQDAADWLEPFRREGFSVICRALESSLEELADQMGIDLSTASRADEERLAIRLGSSLGREH